MTRCLACGALEVQQYLALDRATALPAGSGTVQTAEIAFLAIGAIDDSVAAEVRLGAGRRASVFTIGGAVLPPKVALFAPGDDANKGHDMGESLTQNARFAIPNRG